MPHEPAETHRRRNALWLLPALPVSAAAAVVVGFFAALATCPIGGCTDGFSDVPEPGFAVVYWLVSGALLALPLWLIRYAAWRTRRLVGAVVALGWAGGWFITGPLLG